MLRRQSAFLVLALGEQQGLAIVAGRFRAKFGGEVADDTVVMKNGLQQPAREFLSAVKRYTVHPERGNWPVSQFQIGWTSLPVTIDALA